MHRIPAALLAVTFAVTVSFSATAQIDAEGAASMKAGLDRLRAATMESAFPVIADHMHPAIIAEMGGREAAIGMIGSSYGQMRAAGYVVEAMEAAPPSDMFIATEAHVAIVPMNLTLLSDQARITSSGYLVASRARSGGAWVFIDGSAILDRRALLLLFPGLPDELILPEKKQSVDALGGGSKP